MVPFLGYPVEIDDSVGHKGLR